MSRTPAKITQADAARGSYRSLLENPERDERAQVDGLVDELWRKIELHQGYFFMSDGETFPTKAQFFERIRGRLEHGEEAVKKMRAFLKKHQQLRLAIR